MFSGGSRRTFSCAVSTIKPSCKHAEATSAAASIAAAMHAEALISMTDTVGLLRDPKDPTSLIRRVDLKGVEELKAEGIISGGMIPKVECCTNAIRAGVRKVFIIDGRVPHALLIETLTDEGAGTMFKKEIEGNYVPKS